MTPYPTLKLDQRHFILARDDARTPLRCLSRLQWESFMEQADNICVDSTLLARDLAGDVLVVTSFTGVASDYEAGCDELRPVLFETLVLGGLIDGHIVGSCTWQEARDTHQAVLHGLVPVLAEQKGIAA